MYLYVFAFAALLSGETRLRFRDVLSDLQVLNGAVSRETSISCAWVGMVNGGVRGNCRICKFSTNTHLILLPYTYTIIIPYIYKYHLIAGVGNLRPAGS